MPYLNNTNLISSLLVRRIILASLILSCPIIVLKFAYRYHQEKVELELALDHVKRQMIPILSHHLRDHDTASIDVYLNSISSFSDIEHALIVDHGNVEYNSSSTFPANSIVRSFDISDQSSSGKMSQGKLLVAANLDKLYSRLSANIPEIVIITIAQSLLIISVVLFLVQRLLGRNLAKLAQQLKNGATSSYRQPEIRINSFGQSIREFDLCVEGVRNLQWQFLKSCEQVQDLKKKLSEIKEAFDTELDKRVKQNQQQLLLFESTGRILSQAEIAGGIAHEIKNPLTIIYGYVSMLQNEANSNNLNVAMVDSIVEKIEKTVDRITQTINGLLRLSQRSVAPDEGLYPLKPLISDVIAINREKYADAGIEINFEASELEIKARCQPADIGQIIINLLNNSYYELRNTKSPWVSISLSLTSEHMAAIAVTDSGAGVSPLIHDDILKPFFTTKPPGRGIGLGLSISQAIAQIHGGKLFLDKTSAHTRFVCLVPAEEVHMNQPASFPHQRSYQ